MKFRATLRRLRRRIKPGLGSKCHTHEVPAYLAAGGAGGVGGASAG